MVHGSRLMGKQDGDISSWRHIDISRGIVVLVGVEVWRIERSGGLLILVLMFIFLA